MQPSEPAVNKYLGFLELNPIQLTGYKYALFYPYSLFSALWHLKVITEVVLTP